MIDARIPFDRNSEGFCEPSPEERRFRPDELDGVIYLTAQGEPFVVVSELRKVLTMTPDQAYDEIAKLIAKTDPQVASRIV